MNSRTFYHSKRAFLPVTPYPQVLATMDLLCVSVELSVLDSS